MRWLCWICMSGSLHFAHRHGHRHGCAHVSGIAGFQGPAGPAGPQGLPGAQVKCRHDLCAVGKRSMCMWFGERKKHVTWAHAYFPKQSSSCGQISYSGHVYALHACIPSECTIAHTCTQWQRHMRAYAQLYVRSVYIYAYLVSTWLHARTHIHMVIF